MSTAVEEEPTPEAGFLARRTGLIMPGVLLLAGAVLAIGTATMDAPSGASFPGPRVFPVIVTAVCLVLGVLLAVDVLRRPEGEDRIRSNHRALAEAVGTVVVVIAALQPVGWLLTGAFLFWGIARALGSRRPLFDVALAVAISSIVQLAFSAGLGLTLPPGVLGVFS